MKNNLLIASLIVASAFAHGQQQGNDIPEQLSSLKIDFDDRRDRILKKDEVDETTRRVLWSGKSAHTGGYLSVKSTNEFINLPTQFGKHPKLNNKHRLDLPPPPERGGLELVGDLTEEDGRTSSLLKHGQSEIVFTVWRYKEAGATVTVLEEFFNQSVDGTPAILSLSTPPDMNKALWKLTWWKDGVSYELYVTDNLDKRGSPGNSAKDIVHLGELALRRVR